MSESYLPHTMPAHKTRLVDVASDTIDASFRCVLPRKDIAPVTEHRFLTVVLGNEEFISSQLIGQITIVETLIGVYKRFLPVLPLEQTQKFMERVAELGTAQSSGRLDVNHRHEVLILRTALGAEVAHLLSLWLRGTVEVVGTDLQPITARQGNVLKIAPVDIITAFAGLEVYIVQLAVGTYSLPPHVALIMAHIKAVDMVAGILTLYVILRTCTERAGHE